MDEVESAATSSSSQSLPSSYGTLIVLGYNADSVNAPGTVSPSIKHPQKPHFSRFELVPHSVANGIVRGKSYFATDFNGFNRKRGDSETKHHTVYYIDQKTATVVQYDHDNSKDMYQIGRSSEAQIDFSVVDTFLANPTIVPVIAQHAHRPTANAKHTNGISHTPPQSTDAKAFSSTISRYACRMLVDRQHPHTVSVFAAGFDTSKNIFLGEKATKWRKRNGDYDGLTTNGILVLHPQSPDGAVDAEMEDDKVNYMYSWREVSVDGDVYTLRSTRSSSKRGELVTNETNHLQDGSLIDLCGATLLYRTPAGLAQSPTKDELELMLTELNAIKPQCPVNLMTLVVPRRRARNQTASQRATLNMTLNDVNITDRQPYVYVACGHVQGKHNWGHTPNSGHECPTCKLKSPQILCLSMGMEPALHLDNNLPDHAFNPCGHMGSSRTVKYWSRIELPQGANNFIPCCPFCCAFLVRQKPYVRLHFAQDDNPE